MNEYETFWKIKAKIKRSNLKRRTQYRDIISRKQRRDLKNNSNNKNNTNEEIATKLHEQKKSFR